MADSEWVDDPHPDGEWADDPPLQQESFGKRLARGAIDTLPTVGMVGAGMLATPESLGAATVPAAALGYAGGKELAGFLKNRLLGDEPESVAPMDQLNRVGGNLKNGAMMEMGGQAAGAAMSAIPSMAQGAGNLADRFGAKTLGANFTSATPQELAAGRQALDEGVISPMSSRQSMIGRNESLRTEPGNMSMVNNVDVADKLLQSKPDVGIMPGGTDVLAALGTGGKTIPLSIAKKGIEKYGPQNAAIGLDKTSQFLMKSAPMAKLASENPQVFSALAQNMTDKISSSKNSESSKPYDKDVLLQKTKGSKYAQVLQNASQRGNHALGAAHFVLQSSDPNYRKMTLDEEGND